MKLRKCIVPVYALPLILIGCSSESADLESISKNSTDDSVRAEILADGAEQRTEAARTSLDAIDVEDITAECIDADGDGWGWNGVSSCRVTANSNPEGNGPGGLNAANRQLQVAENCSRLHSGDYHLTELVTDVVLTAGQSNAAGGSTLYEPERFQEDQVNNRVVVWTENNRWEIANPRTQTWHGGKYPSKANAHGNYNHSFNHPAFQIARAVAQQHDCRVVGIIATAAPGMSIDHWLSDQESHYTNISEKVTAAINALPGRHEVDMIWWMQGEADNDQLLNRYFWKLNQLIALFRSEAWFSNDGYFLANETKQHVYANDAINMLRHDGNEFTDYSRGEDSPTDPFPSLAGEEIAVHFNEVSLRKIGNLVADKYLNEFITARLEKRSL